jgi:hypothetical protein
MTKSQLLDAMSSEELSEWIALYRLEEKERKQAELESRAKGRGRSFGR